MSSQPKRIDQSGFLPIRVTHPTKDVVGGIIAVAIAKPKTNEIQVLFKSAGTGDQRINAEMAYAMARGLGRSVNWPGRFRMALQLLLGGRFK